MKIKERFLLLTAAASLSAAIPAAGQNFAFNNGDLILGFQATDAGASTNVFFNLGPGTGFRDNGNQGLLGNIGATLEAAYGNNWYERGDVYFGVFGNLNFGSPTQGLSPTPPVDGDPSRTVYLSQATDAPGQGQPRTANTGSASLGSAGLTFSGMEQMVVTLSANGDGSATLIQTVNPTGWQNSWTTHNKLEPPVAFNVLSGGIQQAFGKGGSATYVDVQRVLATNTGAVPTGIVGVGGYVTTIAISSTGDITSLKPATLPAFASTSGDGMSDFLKELLADYGFEVGVSQPELVNQFMMSQLNLGDIDMASLGYFTETSIQDLVTGGQVMIQAGAANVELAIPVFKSENLIDFIYAGDLELSLPKEGDKQFYRIQLGE